MVNIYTVVLSKWLMCIKFSRFCKCWSLPDWHGNGSSELKFTFGGPRTFLAQNLTSTPYTYFFSRYKVLQCTWVDGWFWWWGHPWLHVWTLVGGNRQQLQQFWPKFQGNVWWQWGGQLGSSKIHCSGCKWEFFSAAQCFSWSAETTPWRLCPSNRASPSIHLCLYIDGFWDYISSALCGMEEIKQDHLCLQAPRQRSCNHFKNGDFEPTPHKNACLESHGICTSYGWYVSTKLYSIYRSVWVFGEVFICPWKRDL